MGEEGGPTDWVGSGVSDQRKKGREAQKFAKKGKVLKDK